MPKNKPQQLAASAKQASADIATLYAEINAVLQKTATDQAYATKLFNAGDNDDRKEVIQLLKQGGIKKTRIDSLELFPGNFKLKIKIDFKKLKIEVEFES